VRTPSGDLNYTTFLDNIINMKREGFAPGWIVDKGGDRSLAAAPDAAKILLPGYYCPAGNTFRSL